MEQGGVAAHVKQAGWVGDFEQGFGVSVVGQGQDVVAGLIGPGNGALNVFGRVRVKQQVGAVASDGTGRQSTGREDGLG